MISCWNKIISCTLWRRTCQDWCCDFHKIMTNHRSTKICNNLASQNNLRLNLRISQIQITIFQTNILICFLWMVNLERKLVVTTLSKNCKLTWNYLDLSCWKICVLRTALSYSSNNFDCRLIVDRRQLLHDFLCLYYNLCCSVKVSQNQKSKILADLTEIFIPADKLYFLADICQS